MRLSPWVFAVLVFALVLSLSLAVLSRWLPDPGQERLSQLRTGQQRPRLHWWTRWQQRLLAALLWLSPWAAPVSGSDSDTPSELQLRFWRAGWRSGVALQVYFTSKTLLTLLLPVVVWGLVDLSGWTAPDLQRWALVLLAAAAGYYLPSALLHWRTQRRQQALFKAFPDALDLLRVCVQAGLGLDAAIERVGREMHQAQPELSEEFALTGMALRAGASRAQALRHLALRIGLKDIDALVSMLIQADRFGTSVSESLQVHSDALRTQRRLRAEEAAAKLPVKLLIPLIFCVFPSLLTVLLGPVVVTLARQFVRAA
jgi:tight adherence protein C